MNLATIADMAERYQVPIGLSDHTLGITAAVTSVAMGAAIIEKHVCLSRDDGGPDAAFSLEPNELAELIQAVRAAEAAIGTIHYGTSTSDANNRSFRRSLFVVEDIQKGQPLTRDNIRSIRPGQGLEPRFLNDVIGKVASQDIARGTPLDWSLIVGQHSERSSEQVSTETQTR